MADRSTARLVLLTLAESPRALTLQEVVERMNIGRDLAVGRVLDELSDRGMLIYRDGRWAIAAVPAVGLWAEVWGEDAFVGDARRVRGLTVGRRTSDQRADSAVDRTRILLRVSLSILSLRNLMDRAMRHTRFRISKVDGLMLPKAEKPSGGTARWSRRLLASVVPHRTVDSVRVVSGHMKDFFDTVGPPPGWQPTGSRMP